MSEGVLVTGGTGFIGSAAVRQYIAETDVTVINVDALTYAGNPESLGPARDHPRHIFEQVDITDRAALDRVFREHRPDAVVNSVGAHTSTARTMARAHSFWGNEVWF